ncbi:MAG: GGDEF domain-containing protein, partial [Spirochaetales bacterium]
RYEGKELAVILTTIMRPSDVSIVAETIRDRATFPYNHHGAIINIGCNIGVSIYPDDSMDKDDLIKFAASAMEEAKERSESFIIFNHELHRSALRKAKLRSEMRQALVAKQFETYYQPIVDTLGAVVGAEALIRWKHPSLGFVPPDEFIPLAEEAGYTIMIGRWMLFRVCHFIKEQVELLGDRYISVNLSAKEFGGEGMVEYIHTVIVAEGISPARLKLEITETESMLDIEDAIDKIRQLRDIGIEVYVDDFGAGYSSLAYLKRLPAAVVKIDRVFMDTLVDNEEDRAFVEGMIRMISGKKMKVLVEGVANAQQQAILRVLGADYLQGFHFSMAIPEQDFTLILERDMRLPV